MRQRAAARLAAGLALGTAVLLAGAAAAAPGGPIDTLPHGAFTCENPGSAIGPRGRHQADMDFTIIPSSSYRHGDDEGTYLLTGDTVLMTSGPLKGLKLHRISDNFLRRIEVDGTDGVLRCVRGVPNNS